MGLFDYVRHEGKLYQTKDFDCPYMEEYRIEGGRLVKDEGHYETVPKPERPYPNEPEHSLLGLCGSMRFVVDRPSVDLNWHGYLHMCSNEEPYTGYRAKFTDGNLVEFVRLEEVGISMSHNTPMTVGDLKALLSALPDYAWVCLQDGPAVNLEKELGGSEPFVLLTGPRLCPHGALDGEACGACEDVKRMMGTGDESTG